MSDKNNKNKKNISDFVEDIENFSFDDIPFAEIGERIKNSINGALRGFSNSAKKSLPPTRNPRVCAQKPPQKDAGVFFGIVSFIGGLTALSAFPMLLDGEVIAAFLSFFLGIAFTGVFWKISARLKKLSNNYLRYLRELGDNTVISIKDLASAVAQSEEETTKDLLYMMKKNYFMQARIVENGKIFILDIPTFKLYKEKLEQIPSYRQNLSDDSMLEASDMSVEDLNSERAKEIIAESIKSLDKLNDEKEKIENLAFRENLGKLIDNSTAILRIIEKYPEKATGLSKFSNYYLPTSLKLVASYKDFELVNSSDPRILKSMGEIEGSIKTIGEAFDKMKIDLLDDRAMDIKTEIDTINLLLKQEGLADDDWSRK